jgi:hypothetical protein
MISRLENNLMVKEQKLLPGTRVRLVAVPFQVTLRTDIGTVLRPDRWQGYYIVHLDQPAIFHDDVEPAEELTEIAEHVDNLEVLPQSSHNG